MKRIVVKIYSIFVLLVFLVSGISCASNTVFNSTTLKHFAGIDNQNPNPPIITGPISGKASTRYFYKFLVTDPDGDYLKAIQIEWGGLDSDNTTYICWLCAGGPLPNGSIFEYGHSWGTPGNYTIRAKIWDMQDNESDWGTLTVTMPYSYNIPLSWFWERFPRAFPVLRYLMGY